MAHELASAFQQAPRIGKLGATKEPDINVSFEGIDIGKCRITYTGGRMAIMQQLSHIVSAIADDLKPAMRDRSQFTGMLTHPDLDSGISLDRTWEPQKLAHGGFSATLGDKVPISNSLEDGLPYLAWGEASPSPLLRRLKTPLRIALTKDALSAAGIVICAHEVQRDVRLIPNHPAVVGHRRDVEQVTGT